MILVYREAAYTLVSAVHSCSPQSEAAWNDRASTAFGQALGCVELGFEAVLRTDLKLNPPDVSNVVRPHSLYLHRSASHQSRARPRFIGDSRSGHGDRGRGLVQHSGHASVVWCSRDAFSARALG